jgi:hypothetical protein
VLGECLRRRILVNDLKRHALGIGVGGTALQNHIVVKGWELIGAETAADAFGYATKFRISSASSVLRCFARLAS